MSENTLILKLRDMQHNIIDHAFYYMTQEDRDRYKKYYIEIKGASKSVGGVYNVQKKQIVLKNANTYNPVFLFIISLHELSHHIECVQRGETKHADTFYKIYKQLIHAAIDLHYLNKSDLYSYAEKSNMNDRNKILEKAIAYHPRIPDKKPTASPDNSAVISCYNSYNCKDVLKQRGYIYNSIDKCWIKEFPTPDINNEKEYLKSLMPERDIIVSSRYVEAIRKHREIEVTGDTYSHRDDLKKLGYRYSDGVWRKRVLDDEAKKSLAELAKYKYVYAKLV